MGKSNPTFEADNMKDFWENGFLGKLWKGIQSLFGKVTGTALTGAEREANEFTAGENTRAMNFSALEAQKNRDFQAEQAATQWQRGVADMQAAGLNPALAYGQGGASAMSGSSPSGSAGSSVQPQASSLSELLQLASFKKQLKLMDAEAEDKSASAAERRAHAENLTKQTSWIDTLNSAELGIKESTARKYGAEVDDLLASAEGKRLYNEWMPKLWEQQYRAGEVDIESTVVGISKTIEEIQELKARGALEWSDAEYRRIMQGVATAQISLLNQQEKHEFAETGESTARTRKISAEAWEAEWKSDFRKEHHVEPDANLWQTVIQVIGGVNHGADRSAPARYRGR